MPWRKRPPVKWSYWTSTTSFGASGCHWVLRSVDQRLGPPGDLPVKPPPLLAGARSFSSFGVRSLRCCAVKEEQKRLPDLRFEQTGPWPPYDFVRLDLDG